MDDLDASAVRGKITLLPGHDVELTSVTFCILDEDHTMGNALRYMLMKDLPHPSENKIHMRVQMLGTYRDRSDGMTPFFCGPSFGGDGLTPDGTTDAPTALRDALHELDRVFEAIQEKYEASLASGIEREAAPQPSVSLRTTFSA